MCAVGMLLVCLSCVCGVCVWCVWCLVHDVVFALEVGRRSGKQRFFFDCLPKHVLGVRATIGERSRKNEKGERISLQK